MSEIGQTPLPHDLQFQQAEPAEAIDPQAPRCVVCKSPIGATYFHASGQVVCPGCADRIQSGQQKPPAISLGRAALYGAGAGLAGCILYAAVAILLHLQIGIIAIVVGIMVGKAVRAGSRGLGGRPQQIMAVVLTYFSITTSYIPVFFNEVRKNPQMLQRSKAATSKAATPAVTSPDTVEPAKPKKMGFVAAVLILLVIFAAAPLFSLTHISGLISLFIIYIGLKRAWMLTGRSEILVMGPYETQPAPAQ